MRGDGGGGGCQAWLMANRTALLLVREAFKLEEKKNNLNILILSHSLDKWNLLCLCFILMHFWVNVISAQVQNN